MASNLASLSVVQLRRAVEIKEQIEALTNELNQLTGDEAPVSAQGVAQPAMRGRRGGRRQLSPEARERIAAAQRARWAKSRKNAPAAPAVRGGGRGGRRRLSPEARARIAAAAKARWAKARAAGRNRLG